MNLIHTISSLLSPANIIASLGLIGVIGVIFAESGLFFGFFLPGDSLLFTAGFIASQHGAVIGGITLPAISFPLLLIGVCIAAIVGDSVGFGFGKSVGVKLYSRPNSRLFKQAHLQRARVFYEKHGPRTIILARFVPIVRTFAPIVAGAAGMEYRKFLSYNVSGGALWSLGLTFLGYFFGMTVPNADRYILPAVIIVILLSFLPPVIELVKSRMSDGRNM
jgi:membrane-associated protein